MKTLEVKLVILGAQGVGKTSIVVQYVEKSFSPHINPTIGASFFTFKINLESVRVKMQVWDTAGQERFQSMAPMYYRNANAALIVYDITQEHSFMSAKSWVKELRRNVEEPIVMILIGNKSDLKSKRSVSHDEALEYAMSIGAMYFETSAMTGEGIDEVFCKAAQTLTKMYENNVIPSIRVYDTGSPSSMPSMKENKRRIVSSDKLPQGESAVASWCC